MTRGTRSLVLVLATVVVGLVPSTASADWFFAVGIGRALPLSGPAAERTETLTIGGVSDHGWIGAEADYGFMPRLENGGEARTLTGSLLVGKRTGSGWRPYGSVGFGHLGPVQTFSDNFRLWGDTAPQKSVLTFGGGVMGDFSRHFGARADVRVFRDLTSQIVGVPVHLTFTRIVAAVYVRF
jgi:hypothetical protein